MWYAENSSLEYWELWPLQLNCVETLRTSTYSSLRRIALASEGPAVLQTSREGGGEETGRLRRQMGRYLRVHLSLLFY